MDRVRDGIIVREDQVLCRQSVSESLAPDRQCLETAFLDVFIDYRDAVELAFRTTSVPTTGILTRASPQARIVGGTYNFSHQR